MRDLTTTVRFIASLFESCWKTKSWLNIALHCFGQGVIAHLSRGAAEDRGQFSFLVNMSLKSARLGKTSARSLFLFVYDLLYSNSCRPPLPPHQLFVRTKSNVDCKQSLESIIRIRTKPTRTHHHHHHDTPQRPPTVPTPTPPTGRRSNSFHSKPAALRVVYYKRVSAEPSLPDEACTSTSPRSGYEGEWRHACVCRTDSKDENDRPPGFPGGPLLPPSGERLPVVRLQCRRILFFNFLELFFLFDTMWSPFGVDVEISIPSQRVIHFTGQDLVTVAVMQKQPQVIFFKIIRELLTD